MTSYTLADNKELNQAVKKEVLQFKRFSIECYDGVVVAWLVVDPIKGCVYVTETKSDVFGFVDVYLIQEFIQIVNNEFELNQVAIDKQFPLRDDCDVEDLDF